MTLGWLRFRSVGRPTEGDGWLLSSCVLVTVNTTPRTHTRSAAPGAAPGRETGGYMLHVPNLTDPVNGSSNRRVVVVRIRCTVRRRTSRSRHRNAACALPRLFVAGHNRTRAKGFQSRKACNCPIYPSVAFFRFYRPFAQPGTTAIAFPSRGLTRLGRTPSIASGKGCSSKTAPSSRSPPA